MKNMAQDAAQNAAQNAAHDVAGDGSAKFLILPIAIFGRERKGARRCTRHLPAAEHTPKHAFLPTFALGCHVKDGQVNDAAQDVAQGAAEDVPQDVAQDVAFWARAERALLATPPAPPPQSARSSR